MSPVRTSKPYSSRNFSHTLKSACTPPHLLVGCDSSSRVSRRITSNTPGPGPEGKAISSEWQLGVAAGWDNLKSSGAAGWDNLLTPTITNDHQRSSDLSIFENDIKSVDDTGDITKDYSSQRCSDARSKPQGAERASRGGDGEETLIGNPRWAEQRAKTRDNTHSSGGC
jgi:hypothetical protein